MGGSQSSQQQEDPATKQKRISDTNTAALVFVFLSILVVLFAFYMIYSGWNPLRPKSTAPVLEVAAAAPAAASAPGGE